MRIFTVLFLVFVLSGISTAQIGGELYELNIQGNGARSAGMGYAFTGVADDATAISTNPAGIAQIGTFEASFVTRLDFGYGAISLPTEFFQDVNVDYSESSNFDLNFASIVLPIPLGDMNAAVGLAYRRYVNFNLEQTVKFDGQSIGDPYKREGGIQTLTGAGALEVIPNLFLGGTANLVFGSQSDNTDDWELDFSGFKIDGGFLFRVEKFSFGAMVSLPWTLGRAWSHPSFEGSDIDYSMPFEATFGAAVRPVPELTLAADFRLRPLSKASYEMENFFTGEKETIDGFWEDVNSFHLGAELVVSMGNLAVPLRAGFYTLPTVAKDFDAYDNDIPPDYEGEQITGVVITGGGGLATGPLVLDLSMELGIIGDYYVNSGLNDPFGQPIPLTVSQGFFRINLGAVVHLGDLMN